MTLAETVQMMADSGCTAQQIAAFVAKVDADKRAKAAEKKRAQRGSPTKSLNVPRTSGDNAGHLVNIEDETSEPRARVVNTNLPSGDISTYPSDRTGKPVNDDPKSRLWSEAVPALIALGVPERQTRGVIGGWLKSNSPQAVLDAVSAARRECPIAPIPWITAALRPAVRAGPSRRPSVTDAILDLLAEGQTQ